MTILAASSEPERIAAFMRGWSLEVTLPKPAEIEALKETLAPGTEVFLSAIPAESHLHLVESAAHMRRAGFEPIPHVSARNYHNKTELEDMLNRSQSEANISRVLVIGGDRDNPAGPYSNALAIIESGLLQRFGIKEIGIGGYPDGHPRIAADDLERALEAKIAAARRAGLKVQIVSQFCFDGERVISWVRRLRANGFAGRVRIGLAGPAKVTTLLRFAQRCGVQASTRGLLRNVGVALQALGRATPDDIVKTLAEAAASGELGEVSPHFYSFGGFSATARWASGVASDAL
jgi:methylenetetrahydrofolate reductase (NADPH)